MTDLLTPLRSRRAGRPNAAPDQRRPLALGAAVAGVASPLVAMLLLWAVGLVGWFAADGGSHGTTRSVLRVAADGWLLAHGANLALADGAVVTASPLGLTAACVWLTYRFGRWAGATTEVFELRSAGAGAVVLGGVYAVVALLTALLAGVPGAEPGFGWAFLGGLLVGMSAGGCGLVRGAGLGGELRGAVPVPLLSVGYAAGGVLVLMLAAGALLTAVALAVQGAAATRVAGELGLDVTGGLLSLLLLGAIAPNLSWLAGSYLLGPGFTVGTGTVVAPQEVTLGPVPSLPVLAALPPDGWSPEWVVGLLAVPVLLGGVAGWLAGRAVPGPSYTSAAGRGLAAGLLGAVALAAVMSLSGGAVGPGRMADIGVDFVATVTWAVMALAPSTAVGYVAATWWGRRRDADQDGAPIR